MNVLPYNQSDIRERARFAPCFILTGFTICTEVICLLRTNADLQLKI